MSGAPRAGRHDDTESVASAAIRAWERVPRVTRLKLASPNALFTKRIWEGLLYHVARDTDPELNPVIRHKLQGTLTAGQAEQLVAAIVGQSVRLDRAGDWVEGLRAAREQVKLRNRAAGRPIPTALTLLSHHVLPAAWSRSAQDRAPDGDECVSLFQSFVHDDPEFPPPTHAAFKALFSRHEEVKALQDILASFTPAPQTTGDPTAARNTEARLLNAPEGTTGEGLWTDYTLLRPWERHLTTVDKTGLSRHAVPLRPTVRDDTQAGTPPTSLAGSEEEHDWAGEIFSASENAILPLDRSIWRRLDYPVRTLVARPGADTLTARAVAHDEARRALAPLGLGSDERRAVLCLGIVSLHAIGAEHSDVLLAKHASVPRRLTELAELARQKFFVSETLRLGSAQHAPVRRALEDPLPGCTRELWQMLHYAEICQEAPGGRESDWQWALIRVAAQRYLQVLQGELHEVLDAGALEAESHLSLTESLVDTAAPTDSATVAYRGPQSHQLVVDVIIDGLEQQGITGIALIDWIHRFIDPLHGNWAKPAWEQLYTDYRFKHQGDAKPTAFPPIPFEHARDIVTSLYHPESGDGDLR